ncbi:MAG: GntR family transcriptional regulator [Kiritimatiellae bacterium]|nr:GntR family transcriptional regulator [Kiritimatiellia bacterium]
MASNDIDQTASSATLSNQAYEYIQSWLVDQRWGTDQRISEQQLARELGISRTPVRESIRRLVSEGVLYQLPSSGTYVAKPDRRQIIEIYEVRLALEGIAAAKSAEFMKAADIIKLSKYAEEMHTVASEFRATGEKLMDGEKIQRFVSADMAFHRLLLQSADNRLALKIVTEGHLRSRVFGLWSHERDLHHVAWVWLAHARIVQAIQQRNPVAARRWMEKHVRNSLSDTLKAYAHQAESDAPFAQALARATKSAEKMLARKSKYPQQPEFRGRSVTVTEAGV